MSHSSVVYKTCTTPGLVFEVVSLVSMVSEIFSVLLCSFSSVCVSVSSRPHTHGCACADTRYHHLPPPPPPPRRAATPSDSKRATCRTGSLRYGGTPCPPGSAKYCSVANSCYRLLQLCNCKAKGCYRLLQLCNCKAKGCYRLLLPCICEAKRCYCLMVSQDHVILRTKTEMH